MASRNFISIPKSHNSNTIKPPPSPTPSCRCLCSPTTHLGSFRCSVHKKPPRGSAPPLPRGPSMHVKPNSLKAILLQIIKPSSSHGHHKRKTFHQKPTRFCLMNGNRDAVAVS
ncbi:hypothetical protein Lalb_Chr12g0198451 [Lupinus albus]|uniref:Uncharacterized protein n=1 Tax=Lupinus albus TaxID=3870 RepID=A0A6A4PLJ6_LUPAL|nr:hypothetical protein Lalb_Chr12g0198451 [Lupinus albus]